MLTASQLCPVNTLVFRHFLSGSPQLPYHINFPQGKQSLQKKSCRASLLGGLTHLPAIPTSVNSFQGWQHCKLAGKCSHSFGTTQETPTSCAEGASRVAGVLLQFWLWKFPWEYLQHHYRMVSALSLWCWQDISAPIHSHIPVKKKTWSQVSQCLVFCATCFLKTAFYSNNLLSVWMTVGLSWLPVRKSHRFLLEW